MPAYLIDFVTERGPRQRSFTLDDERPLAGQLQQVLAELLSQGQMLVGGSGDVLTVFWGRRRLDTAQPLARLKITPERAIELRMQRPQKVMPMRPDSVTQAPVRAFVPTGVYASAVVGGTGGWLAWMAASFLTDLTPMLPSYAWLDLFTAGLLGLVVGSAAMIADSSRRNTPLARSLAAGALLGLASGTASAAAALGIGTLFLSVTADGAETSFARLLAWALLGAGLGLSLGMWRARANRGSPRVAVLIGLGTGLIAGCCLLMPGASDVWQAAACTLLGVGVCAGVATSAFIDAGAVLELETIRAKPVGLFRLREWPLHEGSTVVLNPLARRRQASNDDIVVAKYEDQHCWIDSSERVALRDGDLIDVGSARFRFRRLRSIVRP